MKEIDISKNLKTLLLENQKSSKDLADYLDVSYSLISSYLTKNTLPPIDKIIKIADFFDITIDALIFKKNKDEFNLLLEPKVEYGSFTQKNRCVITGGDCSFRVMEHLRKENETLKNENAKLKKG